MQSSFYYFKTFAMAAVRDTQPGNIRAPDKNQRNSVCHLPSFLSLQSAPACSPRWAVGHRSQGGKILPQVCDDLSTWGGWASAGRFSICPTSSPASRSPAICPESCTDGHMCAQKLGLIHRRAGQLQSFLFLRRKLHG